MSELYNNSIIGTKYCLVVGVNKSSKLPSTHVLHHAESDARKVSHLLAEDACGFISPHGALYGATATTGSIRNAVIDLIKENLRQDNQDGSLLLFYFIGHSYAIRDIHSNIDIYLVTSDFDPKAAKFDPGGYLSFKWIWKTILENEEIGDVLVVLDCCYAAEALNASSSSEVSEEKLVRDFTQYLRTLESNYRKKERSSTTRLLIASTAANAPAYEDNSEGEGHVRMTGLILQALQGKAHQALENSVALTISSLFSYLQTCMGKEGAKEQRPEKYGRDVHRWVLGNYPVPPPPTITTPDAFIQKAPTVQPRFDQIPCEEATFDDLDKQQVKGFLREERVQQQDDYRAGLSDRDQLNRMGMLQEEHPNYGTFLCFFSLHTLPTISRSLNAYTQCIFWKDSQRSSKPEQKMSQGNLFTQFTQALEFVEQHFGDHISRKEQPEPGKLYYRVLEEALANALIHREYATEPDHRPPAKGVVVEVLSDRIEISNPGKPIVAIETLQQALTQHPGSHPRNGQIMRIFYLANHVEQTGTGIERIQRWTKEAGLQQPKIDFKEPTFTLTLYRPASPFSWKRIGLFALCIFLGLALVTSSVLITLFLQSHYINPPPNISSPTSQPATASTTIEIASDFPTSGTDTVTEAPLQNGVQMAIDEANGNLLLSGYTLKLVPYDDVGRGSRPDPLVGASNIQKAISDNLIAGIIGPGNSTVAQMELPLANQAPIALISPNTTYPCLTKSTINDPTNCSGTNDILAQVRPTAQLTYFRLATTDDLQGKEAADYFYTTLHYHKVLILNDYSDLYSSGLANAFQHEWSSLGGQALTQALPENYSSVQDYQNVLQNAAPDQPDLIYFAGDDPNGTYVLQALANISALQNVALAGGDGIVDNDFLLAAAQIHPHAPVYASLPIQDPAHSGTNVGSDFMQNYISSGYQNYRAYAASAYDCTMMLIQAIKMALQKVSTPHGSQDVAGAKQFRLAILQALAHLPYTGATGTHSFDTNGDTTNHTISFYQLDLSKPQATWDWKTQVNAS